MTTNEDLCAYSDLDPDSCAHCRGNTRDAGFSTPAAPEQPAGRVIWSPTIERQRQAIGPRISTKITAPIHHAPTGTNCRCGRPAHNNATICEPCATELAQALGDVPWLTEELDVTITRQRAAATDNGPTSVNNGLPWHDKAADTQRHLHTALALWARLCHEEKIPHQSHLHNLPDDNLPAISRWLMWRIDGLARHPAAWDAHQEITTAIRNCHRLIDRQPDREFVGPCECGHDLYRQPGTPEARCRTCGNTYNGDHMLDWMRGQVADTCVTLNEGIGLLAKFGLETKRRAVETWAERGRLISRGGNDKGTRTYLFGDLIELAIDTRRRNMTKGKAAG